ncbi:MAG: DUF2238 domain-containing protein [archaeon]
MFLKKGQWPIFIVNLIYLTIALFIFLDRRNYEFVMYVGVIVVALIAVLLTNNRVNYPNSLLWGLTVWGIIHMAGSGVILENGEVLYSLILIPLSAEYNILRYDQFVHIVGFGVATLLMYVLVKPNLKNKFGWWSLGIVVVMAGLGVGALNEIIEFIAVVTMPETGVGGYINSSLDLVSDLVGAILAMIWIVLRNGKV